MKKTIHSFNKLEAAIELWDTIPTVPKTAISICNSDITRYLLNPIHIGPYYYFIFNSRTHKHEISGQSSTFNIIYYSAKELTIEKILDSFHPEDLPYFYAFEKDAQRFYSQLPPQNFFKYKFSYDIRILDKDQVYKRILLQVIPLSAVDGGGLRTLNIMTNISHLKQDGKPTLSYIGMDGEPSFYDIQIDTPNKELSIQRVFTKREKEILSLVISGKRSKEIAEKLFISKLTVDTHRKNILSKSGCNNVNELITKSIRNSWI